MNIALTNGSMVKSELYAGNVDFDNPSSDFRALLMREGFSYNASSHKYRNNIKATTGAVNMTVDATTKTITRQDAGSFVTDGFVTGNYIETNNADNQGPYKISSVSASALRLTAIDAATFTTITTGAATAINVTAIDEVKTIDVAVNASADGTASTLQLLGADAGKDWFADFGIVTGYAFTTDNVTNPGPFKVTAVDGDTLTITATSNASALSTLATASFNLSNGYATDNYTVTFKVSGNTLTLDSFDISDFEPALFGSPGAVIYDNVNTNKVAICYARFSDWTLSF